jgi:hypothetical protein
MASSAYKFTPATIGQPILTTFAQSVSTNSGDNTVYIDGANLYALIEPKIYLDGTVGFKNLSETASTVRLIDVNDGTIYQTFNLPVQGSNIEIDFENTFDVKCSVAGHVEQRINFKLL